MSIEVRGLRAHPRLRADIARRLSRLLGRRRIRPVGARVAFSDEDGPRGGVGIRSTLTVRLPGRPVIRVEHQARTYRQAFERGFERLKRQLKRATRRRWQGRRYRRKPLVAERRLETQHEATTERRRRTS